MPVQEITLEEKQQHVGRTCPQCKEGVMVERVDHDAMAGNRVWLECNRLNPCNHRIDIVGKR